LGGIDTLPHTDDTGDVHQKGVSRVEGSRKRRIYDELATPFERLKHSPGVDPVQIAAGGAQSNAQSFCAETTD